MKTWEVPEILNLAFDMTQDSSNNAFTHHCHATEGVGNNCPGGPSDHSSAGNKTHTFTGSICPEHSKYDAEACCCYVAPPPPSLS